MGGVEEISSKCCKFFKCGKTCSSTFFKLDSFKVKVFEREFFKLLKKFQLWSLRKCVEESSSIHWKFEVCAREVFELLKGSSFKCVKENSSHCCKFQVKFQACAIFFFKFMWGVKDLFQSFQSFETSVCCNSYVQNVFFSNGVFESHGKVWWWQLSPLQVQNAHDAF